MILREEVLKRVPLRKAQEIITDRLSRFNGDTINKMLYLDVTESLPNDMLNKVDRMSMRNSLEVRVPFLDHKVVEFAFSIEGRGCKSLRLFWFTPCSMRHAPCPMTQ